MAYRSDPIANGYDVSLRTPGNLRGGQWRALSTADRLALIDRALRPANDLLDAYSIAR